VAEQDRGAEAQTSTRVLEVGLLFAAGDEGSSAAGCGTKSTGPGLHRNIQRNHATLLPTERIRDPKSRSAAGRASYPAAAANCWKARHTACAPLTSRRWADRKTSLTSGPSTAPTVGLSGASHARTAGGDGRGGRTGAACPNNGGRSSDATAGPLPRAGVVPAPTADAGDAAAPPPLVAAAAPAGRGGFRHSRLLGSYGSRKPGGDVGRAGMGGRALVGPGVAGVEGAGTAPVAASAADGIARGAAGGTKTRSADGRVGGAADRAPPGLSEGVAGDGSVSAKRDVVRWHPVGDGGAACGAPGVRRPAGVGDADDDGRGRSGGAGTETADPPARAGASPRRGAPGRRARRGGCRGQRARQATTDRAPRGGCSALRAERSLPLVCNDSFGGLDMHGGNYLHESVIARVNYQSGN